MKRIVMSLGTLVFVAAVVAGGTGAFFSDTETSTGNVFTAGSVTLLLNDITHDGNDAVGFGTTEDETGISFAFDDLKPLDTGTVSFQVLNGANEAFVCARVLDQGGADNTVVNPEADLGDDDTEGELDQFLSFAFDGGVGTIADVDGQWTELMNSPLAPNAPTNSSFDYCFGEFDGSSCVLGAGEYNLAQTDSLSADVEFYAVQTRNNEDFSCDSLNEPEPVVVTPSLDPSGNDFDVLGDATLATLGSGSWANDTANQAKTTFYPFFGVGTSPELGTFTIDDIKSISYKTNKPGAQGDVDFYYSIYTEPDGVDDTESWYGYRLNTEPYYSRSLSAPANSWNTWTTDLGATNESTFFDEEKLNAFGVASGQPTLSELQASAAFDWDSVNAIGDTTGIDYGSELVKAIAISTGSAWDSSFDGNIDEFVIELNNGNKLTIDLEPDTI